ncbi:MAG: dTDP-glucose 4,6-dehydratase [Candidatus Zixiibacteriota bacterium]
MKIRKRKNILITGGAGFIGSNFTRLILEKYPEAQITVVDKLTYAGDESNLSAIMDKIDFRREDIADAKSMMSLFEEKAFDTVINFAAESHVDRSLVDSSPFLRSNITGTAVLLEAARKFKPEVFCQISTDEIYGSIEEGSFTENSPMKPSSPYSASKAAADNLANAYFTSFDVPIVITRSSNNYGPYQYPEKLIPFFTKRALHGESLTLYGDGLNVRDWLHVEDNCKGILTVIEKGVPGQAYNIGANVEKTNAEIAEKIIEITGNDVEIEYVKDRLGHDRRYSLDISKIKSLGWQPEADFEEKFEFTIKWYEENQDFWKKK